MKEPLKLHAVHGRFLRHRLALPPAIERTGRPSSGHHHAKPQNLPQGTRQEADRTWPVPIPLPWRSVCHRLEGLQAHPLPEQLPGSVLPGTLTLNLVAGTWEPWTRTTRLHV